eukprot:COSAG06_NODE_135_length_22418_cov_9.162104_5_plen_97_part_00
MPTMTRTTQMCISYTQCTVRLCQLHSQTLKPSFLRPSPSPSLNPSQSQSQSQSPRQCQRCRSDSRRVCLSLNPIQHRNHSYSPSRSYNQSQHRRWQ